MVEDPQGWVAMQRNTIEGLWEESGRLQTEIETLTASATGARGEVRVSVSAGGVLTHLMISERATDLSGTELASEIMATVGRARASATADLKALIAAHFGEDAANHVDEARGGIGNAL